MKLEFVSVHKPLFLQGFGSQGLIDCVVSKPIVTTLLQLTQVSLQKSP